MVWYPKDDFDAAGYEVPETCDDLIALSDQIVADGSTPWCVGFESEGATGLAGHRLDGGHHAPHRGARRLRPVGRATRSRSTTPPSMNAGEVFGEVMFADGYVLGGADAHARHRLRRRARLPMFDDPPGCWLHRQASFINAFFPEDAEAGVDYDWFPFPPIDQEGTLYAGELTVVGTNGNRPEVVDFLERFIAEEVQCAMGGVQASSRISPNVDVGPDCYANEILADASVILTDGARRTGTGRFDASDLMPAEVGQGSFWTGMIDYMQGGPDSLAGRPRRHRGELAVVTSEHSTGASGGRCTLTDRAERGEPRDRRREPAVDPSRPSRPVRALAAVAVLRSSVVAVRRRLRRCGGVRLPPRRRRQPARCVVGVAIVVGVGGVFFLFWAMNQARRLAARRYRGGRAALRVRRAGARDPRRLPRSTR